MKRTMLVPARFIAVLVLLAVGVLTTRLATANSEYEVWAVDQSGSAGTLYIYDGTALVTDAAAAQPEVINLDDAVRSLCQSQTGSTPTRAHMLAFTPDHTHAILAYVATGHVVVLNAASRSPLACIDVGAQAHGAFPTPDGKYVIVANQNGKLLQRIRTDYEKNEFALENEATLDLANCTTPNGVPCQSLDVRPDNAPICPVIDASGRLTSVTLRGGGLFVVDATTTPMSIIAEYDKTTVHPDGCGGVQKGTTMYLNSGGAHADVYAFNLSGYPTTGYNAPSTPAPTVVFSKDDGKHDSHGMLLNRAQQGRYLWAADRFANQVEVVDTTTNTLINTFDLVSKHSTDPAPDLMDIAPDGKYAFVSLRGPCPLTANAPARNNAVGATPGVGVIAIQEAGYTGKLVAVARISSPSAPFTCGSVGGAPTLTERADPHALNVRRK